MASFLPAVDKLLADGLCAMEGQREVGSMELRVELWCSSQPVFAACQLQTACAPFLAYERTGSLRRMPNSVFSCIL